jgi:polysaccharide biosynthesis transport protein
MTFGQFLSMIAARWRLVVALVAATTLGALAISLLLPKQYMATASLVFDMRPDPVSPAGYDSLSWPVYLATQVQILESDRVSERVVNALGLKNDAALREAWTAAGQLGSFEGWLVERVRRSLDVKLARETNVVRVNYKSNSPQFSAKAANAVVQGYLDTVLDMRVNPARQYSNMFEVRAKELRAQLEKAQGNLTSFQRQKGIIANDERLDVETARLNELSAQLVALQAVAAESSGRQSAVARTIEQSPDVQANALVSGLKGDLLRQEARLQELNSRLGDAHPQVVEARANINALRSRIESESRRVAGSVGVTNTINRQREAEIRAAYESQRTRVMRLKEVRDESQTYIREVDAAQKALDAVQSRFNQSALESQSTQSNASVLTQATAPLLPSSPRIVLNTLVAAFLSSLLAVALAVLLESMNRRVRSVEDVTQALGVPVLGSLPVADRASGVFGTKPAPALPRRVLGQLPLSR